MMLISLFNWIISLFRFKQKLIVDKDYRLSIVSELPEFPSKGVLYVEGNALKEDYWYAFFKCPCGCEDSIMLNLIADVSPCWKVVVDDENFTITPSVWRTEKCQSHFWIRDNRIDWV